MLLTVTGNSGCGQTTFAAELGRLGARVCSLDRVGHRILSRPAVSAAVAEELGLDGCGDLSPREFRRMVGKRVFADSGSRRRLESILHPRMRRWAHISAGRLHDRRGLWVLEGALVLELGLGELADVIVVVSDTLQRCRLRAAARDGIDPATVEARWAAQWSIRRKESLADVVVANSEGVGRLLARSRALYSELSRM